MKVISFSVLGILLMAVTLSAQTPNILIDADAAPLTVPPDTIWTGEDFILTIYMQNGSGEYCIGYSMSYGLYSPDSLTIIEYRDIGGNMGHPAFKFRNHFDQSYGSYWFFNSFFQLNLDGALPDTFNHSTAGTPPNTGWPPTDNARLARLEIGLRINEPGTFCIDSIDHPQSTYDWLWLTPSVPAFNGPYCWIIRNCPNQDGDTLCDIADNCPNAFNDDQADVDQDSYGDACDNCPEDYNPGQEDEDTDGAGDLCDNCPGLSNPGQADDDQDGNGNLCDICPGYDDYVDTDGDGVPDGCDQCEGFDDAIDEDLDGTADGCDNCFGLYNPDQADSDDDGAGNLCDICPGYDDFVDTDGDGVPNGCDRCEGFDDAIDEDGDDVIDGCDNCPGVHNPRQSDDDEDGIGDACDPCTSYHPVITLSDDPFGILWGDAFAYYPEVTDPDDSVFVIQYPKIPQWCTVIDDTVRGVAPDAFTAETLIVIAWDWCQSDTLSFIVASCRCGDIVIDGAVNLLDILFLIDHIYGTPPGPPSSPEHASDVNNDSAINLIDILYLIDFIYGVPHGPDPVCPDL